MNYSDRASTFTNVAEVFGIILTAILLVRGLSMMHGLILFAGGFVLAVPLGAHLRNHRDHFSDWYLILNYVLPAVLISIIELVVAETYVLTAALGLFGILLFRAYRVSNN